MIDTSPRRRRFRPSLLMTVAMLATVALTITAGNWQSRRAAEKIERQRLLDERSRAPPLALGGGAVDPIQTEWRRITVTGRPLTERTVLIDNRVHQSRAGYHVLTPIAPQSGGPVVVVNRGWMPGGATRADQPAIPALPELTTLSGVAIAWPSRTFELKASVPEAPRGQTPAWQALTFERYRVATQLAPQPVLMQQTSDAPDGLIRVWSPPATGVERHRMYALQWYSFALLAVVLYVVLNVRRTDPK